MDTSELRAQLAEVTEELLVLADQLAAATIDGPASIPLVERLARDYQEKRLEVRRIRRAVQVEVAG